MGESGLREGKRSSTLSTLSTFQERWKWVGPIERGRPIAALCIYVEGMAAGQIHRLKKGNQLLYISTGNYI